MSDASTASPPSPPHPGSRAYIGLEVLRLRGGSLSAYSWAKFFGWDGKYTAFMSVVIEPLTSRDLVFLYCDMYKMTPKGLAHLGLSADSAPVEVAVLTPAPYVGTDRPLSKKYSSRPLVMREGALDYRDIPSRVGDHLIAHGKKS